jgi:glycosyltransferase involved in cell wall biosynthesis
MDATHAIGLACALRIPLVATFHGWDATVRDEVFLRQSLALRGYVKRRPELARTAARILCVSEFIRQKVLNKGFPVEKTQVHYIGVDTARLTPAAGVARTPTVLFVGRLMENKGCHYLLRAMKVVQQNVPSCSVTIIGAGPERSALEKLIANLGLTHVKMLGTQPPDAVRQWMNRASVLSAPSIEIASGASEGFGLVCAEAQAMGLPVASFATGGIPEVVKHGETGLLAPERDCIALANNIVILLTQSSLWQRFSESGRRRARELFDLETQTAKLENIFRQVIEQHSPVESSC